MKINTIFIMLALFSGAYADDNNHFEVAKQHVLINQTIATPRELGERVTDGLLMRQPLNRPFREVYVAFFERILSSDEYIEAFANLYMKHYSEEELEYVNKVYDDPKMLSYMKKSPLIMQESLILGQKIAQKHMEELEESLKKRALEIEKLSTN